MCSYNSNKREDDLLISSLNSNNNIKKKAGESIPDIKDYEPKIKLNNNVILKKEFYELKTELE